MVSKSMAQYLLFGDANECLSDAHRVYQNIQHLSTPFIFIFVFQVTTANKGNNNKSQ